MESIWTKTTNLTKYPCLTGDLTTEAAVIGGGLAGILSAKLLSEAGVKTVVLEADRIGSGQTKNTTAKITSQHGMIYGKLLSSFGRDKAEQYAKANELAIEEYRRIIKEHQISCHFHDTCAYVYSVDEAEKMAKEAEAARSLGIDASFTMETELPFTVKGAVKFGGQAQFHPLEFLEGISKGLEIFEKSRVLSVEGNRVRTEKGTVTADYIIFASHFPFVNVPGYYFMRLHQERSYVLALEKAAVFHGMYLGVDGDKLSFRREENLILLGGGSHRTGENRKGGKYDFLRKCAEDLWPDCREQAFWSAQDCISLDGVPYIGKFSADMKNWYVATGFGKWGMTSSMAAAIIIRDKIIGKENPYEDVFSPQRFTPSVSAGNFVVDGFHTVKDFTKQIFAPPRSEVEALPAGHGGIVEYQGEKAGVYKDEDGEIYVVSAKCPHLGCQLEWNPDEKSWECPCHGSRFDCRGNLIDNPAQEGLKHD